MLPCFILKHLSSDVVYFRLPYDISLSVQTTHGQLARSKALSPPVPMICREIFTRSEPRTTESKFCLIQTTLKLIRYNLKFFNGPTTASFCLFIGLFKQSKQFLQHINVKKGHVYPVYGNGIRTHNLSNMSYLP